MCSSALVVGESCYETTTRTPAEIRAHMYVYTCLLAPLLIFQYAEFFNLFFQSENQLQEQHSTLSVEPLCSDLWNFYLVCCIWTIWLRIQKWSVTKLKEKNAGSFNEARHSGCSRALLPHADGRLSAVKPLFVLSEKLPDNLVDFVITWSIV